jgi:hypothetical protein
MDVIAQRSIVQSESVAYASAVSEATANELAQNSNHQAKNQLVYVDFKFNNDLGAFETNLDYADGSFNCLRDFDIVGVYLNSGIIGTSGTLEIDIMRLAGPNSVPSSIFSTTPKLTYQAGSYAYLAKDFEDNSTVEPALGATHAVLGITQLNKFDVIYPKLMQVQDAQVDAQITLHLRIR